MARIDDLRATLAQIQASIDKAPVDKRAPLFAQLLACEARIASLSDSGAKGDGIDEVAARRAARRAGGSSHPGRASVEG